MPMWKDGGFTTGAVVAAWMAALLSLRTLLEPIRSYFTARRSAGATASLP
jgi:hypothetical protein